MMLWLRTFGHLARGLLWFGKITTFLAMLCLAAVAMLWWSRGCSTESLATFSGVSGFNLEVSTTDCWHSAETGVFVSKPGQRGKKLLFLYNSVDVPAIMSIGEHAIQIALGDIDYVFCRQDKWEDLTIKYDIRNIRHPGSSPQPKVCK